VGGGFRTGTVTAGDAMPQNDMRRNMPRFQGDNAKQNQALVDALKDWAAKERCTPAQLCIAWELSRKPAVVPLAGSSKRKWLEENAKAAELTIAAATLDALDRAVRPGGTQGDRYPGPMMAGLGL